MVEIEEVGEDVGGDAVASTSKPAAAVIGVQADHAAVAPPTARARRKLKPSNFCTIGIMLFMRFSKIDLDKHVQLLRIGFCAVILIQFMLFKAVRQKVEIQNAARKLAAEKAEDRWKAKHEEGGRRVSRKKAPSKKASAPDRKSFEETVVAKKSPDWGEDEVDTEMTLCEYDIWQLDQRRNNQLFVLALMAFLHLKLKYTTPLLMNVATTSCSFFEDPMIAIFLRGKEAVGDLARPWASSDPLDALGGGGPDPMAEPPAPPAPPAVKSGPAQASNASGSGSKKKN
jgi:hypothetical protein